MTDSILQFFVAAPPPTTKRPYYKRDVLNLCTYASGLRTTLAFKKKWISAYLLPEIGPDSSSLAESTAILIFCEELAEKKDDDIYRFHAIHKAKLLRAIDHGIAVTFEIELLEFVLPKISAIDVHQKLIGQGPEHPNYSRINATDSNPNAKLVRRATNDLRLIMSSNWNESAEYFSGLNGINDSLFFIAANRDAFQFPTFPIGARLSRSGDRIETKKVAVAGRLHWNCMESPEPRRLFARQ